MVPLFVLYTGCIVSGLGIGEDSKILAPDGELVYVYCNSIFSYLHMFVINDEDNTITKMEEKKFKELGYTERQHVQEWLEKTPEILGEDLLIIQKEFDGFEGTKERLDLLALDKEGNLVIIENKLDDSGRDVTWQALKYASYCSTLSFGEIKEIYQSYLTKQNRKEESEKNIVDFLEIEDAGEISINKTQKIILVAREYRKEVTSTALWLLSNYSMQIKCFKIVPYEYEQNKFLTVEQIIPVKEVEEHIIKGAAKIQEEKLTKEKANGKYTEFWKQLQKSIKKEKDYPSSKSSPSGKVWRYTNTSLPDVSLKFIIHTSGSVWVELYMGDKEKDRNKYIFDELYKQKTEIEKIAGELNWERLEDKKACRIKIERSGGFSNKDSWEDSIKFLVENMRKLREAFKKPLEELEPQLKAKKKKDTKES